MNETGDLRVVDVMMLQIPFYLFFILHNSIIGKASSIVIPTLSYSIIHSLSVGFVSVAIFPIDIIILH